MIVYFIIINHIFLLLFIGEDLAISGHSETCLFQLGYTIIVYSHTMTVFVYLVLSVFELFVALLLLLFFLRQYFHFFLTLLL